jgi:hypothetical protein
MMPGQWVGVDGCQFISSTDKTWPAAAAHTTGVPLRVVVVVAVAVVVILDATVVVVVVEILDEPSVLAASVVRNISRVFRGARNFLLAK